MRRWFISSVVSGHDGSVILSASQLMIARRILSLSSCACCVLFRGFPIHTAGGHAAVSEPVGSMIYNSLASGESQIGRTNLCSNHFQDYLNPQPVAYLHYTVRSKIPLYTVEQLKEITIK